MVHAMANDRGALPRVAWFLAVASAAAASCGPRVQPDHPFPEEAVEHRERTPAAVSPGRHVMVGELCPKGAAGRPAIAPLMMRTTQWIDTPVEVINAVERGDTPRFAVFGVDGKPAGLFDAVGVADLPLGQSVASGTY